MVLQYSFRNLLVTTPVATGCFGGLNPPKKLQMPQNWNMKHYKSVDFLSNFRMSVPLHKRSLPSEENNILLVMILLVDNKGKE